MFMEPSGINEGRCVRGSMPRHSCITGAVMTPVFRVREWIRDLTSIMSTPFCCALRIKCEWGRSRSYIWTRFSRLQLVMLSLG